MFQARKPASAGSVATARLTRALAGALLTLLACCHSLGWVELRFLDSLDRFIYDSRLRLATPQFDDRIVIVDIDERSLGDYGRWPWSRTTIAKLVTDLVDNYQAKVVGFDVVFAEPQTNSERKLIDRLRADPRFGALERPLSELAEEFDHDRKLVEALGERPVVLGYYLTSDRGGRSSGKLPAPVYRTVDIAALGYRITSWNGYGANIAELHSPSHASGFFNPLVDPDGVVRRLAVFADYAGGVYESIDLAILRKYFADAPVELDASRVRLHAPRQRVDLPVTEELLALIPFAGRGGPDAGRFRYVSAADVLNGSASADQFRGRIALIGTSSPGLTDLRATPVNEVFPGVEIHAALLSGALDGTIKTRPAHARDLTIGGLILIGAVMSAAMAGSGALAVIGLGVATLAVISLWNNVAWFMLGWSLPIAVHMILALALLLLNLALGYVTEGRSKRHVVGLFGEYVGPALAARMATDPDSARLDSQDKELSILFADIRGFTRMAETMQPQQLREYLNLYLSAMTDVTYRFGGTVDKYIGDEVMSFWGAPIDDPAHAENAVAAALAMLDEVARLNRLFVERNWPQLAVGIGINTGVVRVGDMGSNARRAYTAIGDAVNLASRLQGLTKRFNTPILVGERTKTLVGSRQFAELAHLQVAGRNEPVKIYAPIVDLTALVRAPTQPANPQDPVQPGARVPGIARIWESAE